MAGPIALPTLGIGSTGPAINELQRLLVKTHFWEAAYWGNIDPNVFGPMTQQGVMQFQKSVGLPPTGIVDDATWNQLYVVTGEAKIVSNALVSAADRARQGALLAAQQAAANDLAAQQSSLTKPAGAHGSSGMLGKIILAGGVAAVAYYVYRRASKSKSVEGIAFVDDGEDDAGPAFRPSARARAALRALDTVASETRRSPRPRKRPARLSAPQRESSEREGTATVPEPRQSWGRKSWRTMRDEDTEEDVLIDPGHAPKIIRLEADEKMFKSTPQYREDMKRLAWERARANDREVHIVARGTARAIYKADPRKA